MNKMAHSGGYGQLIATSLPYMITGMVACLKVSFVICLICVA